MARWRSLLQSDGADAEGIRETQTRKLRRLLILARQHCPFHASRLDKAALDPRDPEFGPDHLATLPTMSRDDIRDHLDAMTWFDSQTGGPQPYNTGGSSGEPLKFYFDRSRQAADHAARWRARSWWGVRPGDPEILLWGAPTELHVQDRLRQWRDGLLNQEILNAFDMTATTMEDYAERIRRRQPACLYGYASSLALLARHILRQGKPAGWLGSPRLKAVFVTGEVMLEPDRLAIEKAFGAPAVIEYGCRDGGLLACQHPDGLLHVPCENVIIELLDDNGQPVTPGEVGQVTVTHLEAFAMPIIRYQTGDLARRPMSDDAAMDGRSLTALAEVRGRVTDQIVRRTARGLRQMHALALLYVVRETDGIRKFRITQPSLDRLDVDVVSDERFTSEQRHKLIGGLRERMGDEVSVFVHVCNHIAPSASGKHTCVISHVTCADETPAHELMATCAD